MRLFSRLNPPGFFQATNHFMNSFSWQALKDSMSERATTWFQPLFAWKQTEEQSFFMRASEEAGFMQHQAWRSAFKHQLRTLRQQITQAYREGRMLSLNKLRETLIAEQATFTSKAVSALFYDRSLRRLVQRFPHYAHALEGAANHLRATLKAYPQKALRYFYHDLINHIILWSGHKITLAQLLEALGYYQTLVPTYLYQAIYTALQAFDGVTVENHTDAFHGVARKTVEALLAQINQAFTNNSTKSEEISSLQTSLQRFMEETHALAKQGLYYAKQHPIKVMTTLTVATVVGYRYSSTSADNALMFSQPLSYFSGFNPFQSSPVLPPVVMTLSALPLTLSIARRGSFYFSLQDASLRQAAIPLMTGLLTQILPVEAQTFWAKTLGETWNDNGRAVQKTVDGGYIVTGYTPRFGATDNDLWLIKWADNGTRTWQKSLGGTGNDVGTSVQQTSDGGYIVTGFTTSFGAGNNDLCLIKWDSQGNLTWAKTLGGTGHDYGYSVQQTSDGGYIVAGSTASFGAISLTLWLTKWDSQGNLTWAKLLGGTGFDYGYSVQQTTDGGYIVTGYTQAFGAGGDDLWLTKWAANGTFIWAKTLGGTGDDYGNFVQQTADGGYIVTGSTASFGAGGTDLWLSKWDSLGNLSWVKTLGGTVDEVGYSVQQTTDGGYIVSGSTASFGAGGADLWVSKWDSLGNLSWVKTLGGTVDDVGNSVQQTTDGGYIVTGYTNSFGAGRQDLWLTKWDSQGSITGVDCISSSNVSSVTQSISAISTATTAGTASGVSQNVTVSPQANGKSWLNACDSAPILANSGGSFTYTENDPATVIDNSITVSDIDNINLDSASISISGGFAGSEDVLGFNYQNGISGSYSSVTGVLSLGGFSSVANYQTALRSVTYVNLSDNPTAGVRIFSFIVNDDQRDSNTIMRNATIVAVDEAPVLTSSGGSFTYTENDPATVIDNSITVSDIDHANLISATISINGGFAGSQDVLSFTDQNGITGSYSSGIGVLTLSGSSSVANYQTALQSVRYRNLSDNPTAGIRTFSFTVNDSQLNSNAVTRSATVGAVNDAPVLANSGGSFTYTENDPLTVIDNSITVSDADTGVLVGATIWISGGFAGSQDVLSFTDQNGITGSYSSGTGVYTLLGTASVADYQLALRNVMYEIISDNPSISMRTFSFIVNDGQLNSNTVIRNATIVAVDDAPVLTNSGGSFTYAENDPATVIDNSITVSDIDNTNLINATISISGFAGSQDVLGFVDQNGIIGSYNSGTGILSLGGSSSVSNYQTALRNVTYVNLSDNPIAGIRIFNFTVNDGQLASNPVTRSATIVAVDDAPVLTSNGGSFTYTENDPATVIDSSINVSDIDNTNLVSATISISGGFAGNEDVLSFTDQNGIAGSYSSGIGVLTLSGSSSVTNYQTALRSVRYLNLSNNPTAGIRTFSFTVNDGQLNSNIITRSATVGAVNDAPVLASNGGSFTYTENDPATVIDSSITVSDADNSVLASATISISGGFAGSEDVLGFIDQNGITGSYSSGTGALTLTGSSSVTNYQAALRSVTYVNLSDNPTLGVRTFSFTVNDGQLNSNPVTRSATLVAMDDAPVLTNSGDSFTYAENDPATVIDNSITVSDIDNTNLVSATISISGGFAGSEDVLSFTDQNGITGSYSSGTGVLTLSGSSNVANYQTALRSVRYLNLSNNPTTGVRTFSFIVNDGQLNSNPVTCSATIVEVNDAPVLASNGGSFTYTENDPATVIDSNITISDIGNTNLVSASISISGGFAGNEDVLSFIDQNGITGSYNSGTGVLGLTGSSSIANYQAALRSVTYLNLSDNPTTDVRIFSFTVNDGQLNSNSVTRSATFVAVNDAPELNHNQLTITQGGVVILGSNDLDATDVDTPPDNLQLTVSDIQHGQFEYTAAPGTPVTLFSQQAINNGAIQFVQDGSAQTPAYNVSVSDGVYATPSTAANVNFTPTPIASSAPPNTALIAGLAAGAAVLTIGVLGVSFWYVKRRQRLVRQQIQANQAEAGIELVTPVRQEKGYTVIYGKNGRYALINKLKAKDADKLKAQTGIEVIFGGEQKTNFSLGQGQFGKLRLARNVQTDVFVGVKKVKGETAIATSVNEAIIQSQLNGSPNVMPLFDSVETLGSKKQPVLYQFMPLAGWGNGDKLKTQLSQLTDLNLKMRFLIHTAKRLLIGLEAMHQRQIYHLDFKPANFVIDHQGEAWVIDFGCAQRIEAEKGEMSGGNGDTNYYSPERLANVRFHYLQRFPKTIFATSEVQYTLEAGKVDAWALGVTLLELLTGTYPFDVTNKETKLTQWDSRYFKEKLAQVPEVSHPWAKGLSEMIQGLLDVNPATRWSVERALKHSIFQHSEYEFASKEAPAIHFAQLSQLKKAPASITATALIAQTTYDLTPPGKLQQESTPVNYELTPPRKPQQGTAPVNDLAVEEKPKHENENYAEHYLKQELTLNSTASIKVYQSNNAQQTFFAAPRAEQKETSINPALHEKGGYNFLPTTFVSSSNK